MAYVKMSNSGYHSVSEQILFNEIEKRINNRDVPEIKVPNISIIPCLTDDVFLCLTDDIYSQYLVTLQRSRNLDKLMFLFVDYDREEWHAVYGPDAKEYLSFKVKNTTWLAHKEADFSKIVELGIYKYDICLDTNRVYIDSILNHIEMLYADRKDKMHIESSKQTTPDNKDQTVRNDLRMLLLRRRSDLN